MGWKKRMEFEYKKSHYDYGMKKTHRISMEIRVNTFSTFYPICRLREELRHDVEAVGVDVGDRRPPGGQTPQGRWRPLPDGRATSPPGNRWYVL